MTDVAPRTETPPRADAAPRCPVHAFFRPPAPQPLKKKGGPVDIVRRFFRMRHSSLSMISERGYRMRSGRVGLPGYDFVLIADPADVRRVLTADVGEFPKSTLMGRILHHLVGNGIFVSSGDAWRRQRRMMAPAFELARVKDVFAQMAACVADMEERVERLADGEPHAIDLEMTHVTADIIFRTLFSRPIRRDEAEVIFGAFARFQEIAYADGIAGLACIPSALRFVSRLRAARAAGRIRAILDGVVAERYRSARDGAESPRRDILAALLAARDPQDGTPFTFQELCEQVAVMFLAGHETSASALSWALYLLAASPQMQERVHREAVAVMGARPARFEDMKQLALTRDVFRETLRLYPPVSFILRDATCPGQIRDKQVEPGGVVMASPWISHRHRDLWSHPDLFDPDRFETPEGKASARDAYFPFGMGPRVCLGAAFALQEATLVLASLARRYRFHPVAGREPVPVARLTLRSDNGVWLWIERR